MPRRAHGRDTLSAYRHRRRPRWPAARRKEAPCTSKSTTACGGRPASTSVTSSGSGSSPASLGGVALLAPIVLWAWNAAGHGAFDVLMAPTAWLFGLQHYSQTSFGGWSALLGLVLIVAYVVVSGLVFSALADRVYGIRGPVGGVAGGLAWAFVSFIFFWYMLLPLARLGAPFRAAPATPELFVAPTWVWILGFTLLGLVSGLVYGALRVATAGEGVRGTRGAAQAPMPRAA